MKVDQYTSISNLTLFRIKTYRMFGTCLILCSILLLATSTCLIAQDGRQLSVKQMFPGINERTELNVGWGGGNLGAYLMHTNNQYKSNMFGSVAQSNGVGIWTEGVKRFEVWGDDNFSALKIFPGMTWTPGKTASLYLGSELHYMRVVHNSGMTLHTMNNIMFKIAGTEKMRVHDNGNVGIGVSSPTNKLDIYGGSIKIRNGNGGGSYLKTQLELAYTNGQYAHRIATTHNSGSAVNNGIGWYTYGGPNQPLVHGFTLLNGKFGVGTTSPTVKFEVAGGDALFSDDITAEVGNFTSVTSTGNISTTTGTISGGTLTSTGNISTATGTVSGGTLTSTGNISTATGTVSGGTLTATTGVNTSLIEDGTEVSVDINSESKLKVKATGVEAENMKVLNFQAQSIAQAPDVALGWSDYVFNADYRLKSLKEVEKFIEKNHHLPGVPSEEEVHKNGYEMAKMDAILLEKIEEMMLHLIAIKKENEMLKSRLDQMK